MESILAQVAFRVLPFVEMAHEGMEEEIELIRTNLAARESSFDSHPSIWKENIREEMQRFIKFTQSFLNPYGFKIPKRSSITFCRKHFLCQLLALSTFLAFLWSVQRERERGLISNQLYSTLLQFCFPSLPSQSKQANDSLMRNNVILLNYSSGHKGHLRD